MRFLGSYAQELRIAVAGVLCGSLLLFPRLLLVHEIAPTPIRLLEQEVADFFSFKPSLVYEKSRVRMKSFKPAVKKESEKKVLGPDELHMEGIIYEESGDSTVIINDEIVKVGDRINQFVIQEIGPEEVRLEKDGKAYVLSSREGLKPVSSESLPSDSRLGPGQARGPRPQHSPATNDSAGSKPAIESVAGEWPSEARSLDLQEE